MHSTLTSAIKAKTLSELLQLHAKVHPGKKAYIFLDPNGEEEESCTYEELARRAGQVAASLRSAGATGKPVMLLFPAGLEYVTGLFGCFFAGAIAVPAYPVTHGRNLGRLVSMAIDAHPRAVLGTQTMQSRISSNADLRPLKDLEFISLENLDVGCSGPEPGEDDLALLQYTSGSTGTPRGVMVSHANLMHNLGLIREAFRQNEDSVVVSWLPPYHDMGLIGGILQPLYAGAMCILMSPASFLQKPERWLHAIGKYRATTSGGPNFAYDLCVRKIRGEERTAFDLSTWTAAFNGAEPVRAETLARFADAFAVAGFSRKAFYPCYGLAEATLFVSGGIAGTGARLTHVSSGQLQSHRAERAEPSAGSRALVSCGQPFGDQKVRIVNPESLSVCKDGEVGEIWVTGKSVAQGYWKREDETKRTFPIVSTDERERAFLRTGDLGFVLDGELYITGRLKEMMIFRGRNCYPQDIERTAQSCAEGLGIGAAFSVDAEGEERLVLLQECDRSDRNSDWQQVMEKIRSAVAGQHEVGLYSAAIVKPGTIPRTTSGKIRRTECRSLFTAGKLPFVLSKTWTADPGNHEIEPKTISVHPGPEGGDRSTVIANLLRQRVSEMLEVPEDRVDVDTGLVNLGLDSVMSADLANYIEQAFGAAADLRWILDGGSIRSLALQVAENLSPVFETSHSPARNAESSRLSLSSDQERLWFATQAHWDTSVFNLQAAYRILGPLRIDILERSVEEIARRHSSLRASFAVEYGNLVQILHDRVETPFRVVRQPNAAKQVEEFLRDECRRSFGLAQAPLWRVTVLEAGKNDFVLALTVHHIICDAWSLGIFLKDLEAVYAALADGIDVPPVRSAVQFSEFLEHQNRLVSPHPNISFWRDYLAGAPALDLPADTELRTDPVELSVVADFHVLADLASRLKQLAAAEGTTLFGVLLSAFQVLLALYSGQNDFLVGMPVKARPGSRFENVLGFFARPILIRTNIDFQSGIRQLPGKNWPSVVRAYASQDVPFSEIARIAPQAWGGTHSSAVRSMFGLLPRQAVELSLPSLDVSLAGMRAGTADCDLFMTLFESAKGLQGTLLYNAARFESETAEKLIEGYCAVLQQLASDAEVQIDAIALPAGLQSKAQKKKASSHAVRVAASFTGEPLGEFLDYWLNQLDQKAKIEFVPPGQVLQQLLDHGSRLAQNIRGVNLVLVRSQDLRAHGQSLEDSAAVFVSAMTNVLQRTKVPYVICICPGNQASQDPDIWEALVSAGLSGCAGAVLISSAETLNRYSVGTHSDEYREQIAGIPYTEEFFAALATLAARKIGTLLNVFTTKVIVLDCDNTLWKGICGEDGPEGITVTEGRRKLQEFVIAQQERGVLLCLCSKNNPGDVDAAFSRCRGMLLRPEHITASRVNWRPKAENIRELADELGLGLESFVFVDDDSLECEAMRRMVPEVITLQLPQSDAETGDFLERLWAFDSIGGTQEGHSRTKMYRENAARESLRRGALTVSEFLDELQLQIEIDAPADGDLRRVVELVTRTNQFNMTMRRRSFEELRALLSSGALEGKVVRVRDRFGDYGLVGVMLFHGLGTALELDTFLLSCRALGRGVEHRMAAGLAKEAVARNLQSIRIPFLRAQKNQPAQEFLNSIEEFAVSREEAAGMTLFAFPAGELCELRYKPLSNEPPATHASEKEVRQGSSGGVGRSALMNALATELIDAARIMRAIRGRRRARPLLGTPWMAAQTATESRLAAIVEELLGIDCVGAEDNFFDMGGHSLLATQLAARVQAEMCVEVALLTIFEAPTVRRLAAKIERCSDSEVTALQLIRIQRNEPLPVSLGQERLWFLDQLHPNDPFYNLNAAVKITGPLDVSALRRAVQEIADRHETLRTRFSVIEGHPVQVVDEAGCIPLQEIDLSHMDELDRQPEAERLAGDAATVPFVLSEGPLARLMLIRMKNQEHVLALVIHHIISDGWSLHLFMRELFTLYEDFVRNRPASLPPLAVQYGDFVAWQRKSLDQTVLRDQLGYWKEQLSNVPVLDLPADRARPAIPTHLGDTETFSLTPELTAAMRSLAQRSGVTVFVMLMAIWKVLVYRYTGSQDIVTGTPVAGRSRVETESLIGFLLNTLALRIQVSGNSIFHELLDQVRTASLAAFARQDVPFEKLVAELQPERSLSHTPIFQVLLGLFAAPEGNSPRDLRLEVFPVRRRTAILDLNLFFTDLDGRLDGAIEYSTDLFDKARIVQMHRHLIRLLEEAVAHPGRNISDLTLLTAQEYRQLTNWTEPMVDRERDVVSALFAAQVKRTPDAEALVCGVSRLTYAQVNARANRIANYLRKSGAGPETLIGVCLPRTEDLVPVLLGILKSGAAYVPLDPEYPAERLSMIASDARLHTLITYRNLMERFFSHQGSVLCLDAEAPKIAEESDRNPSAIAACHNLAYVIYTSGSTGRPKGVAIQHRNVAALLDWSVRQFSSEELSGMLASTSICFDLSVFEIFAPLVSGGKVILVPNALDWNSISNPLEVTLINTVPSVAAQLVRTQPIPTSVRTVVLCGEALSNSLVKEIYRHKTIEKVYNLYGPTEDTVYSTWCLIPGSHDGVPPIGRPLFNTQAHILDRDLQPVPPGHSGELFLGGEGLSRGYLGQARLTAERFIPDSFSGRTGARIYKTGDLTRRRQDGEIEYLGRLDHQIKLRGFRIELGEIEFHLTAAPEVEEAVVVPRRNAAGSQILVAYVVARKGHESAVEELRNRLAKHLPEYMIPSCFEILERFPFTPNGKIDRNRLPQPSEPAELTIGCEAGPQTEVEILLAGIWRDVLGKAPGIHDNFFSAGGDSILSIQIASRAQQSGIDLSPRQLFQYQTIAELAAVVSSTQANEMQEDRAQEPAPLTPVQRWFFEQNFHNPHHWNQSVLLEIRHSWSPELLRKALGALLMHHDALRHRFIKEQNSWRQFVPATVEEPIVDYVDLSHLDPGGQKEAIRIRSNALQACLNIEIGPMFRAAVFKTGGAVDCLLLIAHHLVVDAVSWRILAEDLESICSRLDRNQTLQLPAKTVSLLRWSAMLQSRRLEDGMRAELPWWLGSAEHYPGLPVDFSGGDNIASSTRECSVSLTADETRFLTEKCAPRFKARSQEVLIAALLDGLCAWTGQNRFVVDMEGHGREEIGAGPRPHRTIGWFTSVFPVRFALTSREPVSVLKAAKEQMRAIPGGGMGYGILAYPDVDDDISARLRARPKADISFNYLGNLDQGIRGDAFTLMSMDGSTARDPQGIRPWLLDVVAWILDGRLQAKFFFSENIHSENSIRQLGDHVIDYLRTLIAAGSGDYANSYLPSDFPLATLNSDHLEAVLAGIEKSDLGDLEDIRTLSPVQHGMLFHSLYKPESGIYCMQIACTLTGALDLPAFQYAWQRAVDRHDVLRTSFLWNHSGEPVQMVHGAAQPAWRLDDWRDLPADVQEEQFRRKLQADRDKGFDLSKAPLMNLALMQTGAEEYRFLWNYHHAIIDGWTSTLLLKEVLECYEALLSGAKIRAAAVPRFGDYIAWQRQQDMNRAEAYWRNSLAGFTGPARLTIDAGEQPSSVQGADFEDHRLRLSADLSSSLQTVSRGSRLTLYTLLQGAWALLLGYFNRSSDVVFGVVSSGRPARLAGVDSMAGLFVNTLPVRVALQRDKDVLSWLGELQHRQAEQRQYEYVSLVQIQNWTEVPRVVSLFETIFSLNSYPTDEMLREPQGTLGISDIRVVDWNSFPLSVAVTPGSEMEVQIKYDRRRFLQSNIERAAGLYEHLLQVLTTSREASLGDLLTRFEEADNRYLTTSEAAYQTAVLGRFDRIKPRSHSLHPVAE